jgi:hypothetical protein
VLTAFIRLLANEDVTIPGWLWLVAAAIVVGILLWAFRTSSGEGQPSQSAASSGD